MMDVLDYCKRAVDAASRLGADYVDAYGVNLETIKVELKKGVVRTLKSIHEVGVNVRAIVKGAMGYSYTVGLDVDVEAIAGEAVKAAKAGCPDPAFKGLPTPSAFPSPGGTCDGKTASLTPEEVVEMALSTAKTVESKSIYSVNVTVERSTFKCFVANSNGVEGVDEGTYMSFFIYVTAKDGTNMSSSYDGDIVRSASDLDPYSMASKAAQEALEGLQAKPYKTARVPAVLSGKVLVAILVEGVAASLNADLVQRGRSCMSTWMNRKVSSEGLTIIDNGVLEKGLLSGKFDAEGSPKRLTPLIDRGIVKGLLHNSYTAGKAGVESTGNAFRSGGPLDFRGQVTIAPTNVIVQLGDWSLEEMLQEVRDGLLILDTHDSPNIATGDLSAMVSQGYIVEKGEIKAPVKQALFAINIIDLLKGIKAIGKDRTKYLNLYAPPILVSEIQVSSRN